jgi:hypothetical protein
LSRGELRQGGGGDARKGREPVKGTFLTELLFQDLEIKPARSSIDT